MSPTTLGLKQLSRDLAIYPQPETWYSIPHICPPLKTYTQKEARQRLNWSQKTLYILGVGRLAALKQFPALIEACAQLQHPSLKLILTGEGNREALQQIAQRCGLAERLEFSVSDDMGLYYSAADIYVSTSLTEAFGLANLEAISMGLPAICTAVGGVPEVVGQGAWLIPPNQPQALFNALQSLVNQETLRNAWQQQAQQWVRNLPTASHILKAYLAMYRGENCVFPTSTVPLSTSLPHHEVQTWAACPLPQVLTLPTHAKILLIAPHPDDEVLGCGGTLALLRQHGCEIKIVVITDGGAGDPLGYSPDVRQTRQQESIAAMRLMGIEDVVFLNAPDGAYQHTPEISDKLADILKTYQANWILFPSVLDYHRDHVAISLTIMELWQQTGCREKLLCYETWATVPATNLVDISPVFELKMQAIQCYALPLQYGDYLNACKGMATYRGLYFMDTQTRIPKYAEAFLEITPQTWQSLFQHLWSIRRIQEHAIAAPI
jgi:LmbE family N-acetylglucosaminyl deacetylase